MTPVVRKRIGSGLVLAVAGVGILYLPTWIVAVLLPALVALTQLEFYTFFDRAGLPVFRVVGTLMGTLLVSGAWLAFILGGSPIAADVEAFLLFAALATVCLRHLPRRHDPAPLITLGCTILGILYVPYLFTFMVKLAYTWDTPGMTAALGLTGRRLFVYFLAVVKLTDVGAYVCGSLWGRHRLMPRISPGKTIEGLLGGILTGLLASLCCWWLWGGRLGALELNLARALALGIILPLAGVVGDLMESMFKRAAGAKDSSSCFPGLGGLLDVLDSLLFTAPVLYLFLRLV